jgi:hypothetical protein
MTHSYGISADKLTHIHAIRTTHSGIIDGDLNKPMWQDAPKSPRFVDMVSGEPAYYDTRVAVRYDDTHLYVGYWVEEPFVTATMTERDSFIWFDNDIELFIGGDDCYYELEINAHGTIYECFFIWQDAHKPGGRFDRPEFDVYMRNVDILGGFQDYRYGKHPRGRRWGFLDFDMPGVQVGVQVQGSINDNSDIDKGWSVEVAIPWASMAFMFKDRVLPPAPGETLRCDFSRFEALRLHGAPLPQNPGWSLNPHGVYDSHIPESFSVVHF